MTKPDEPSAYERIRWHYGVPDDLIRDYADDVREALPPSGSPPSDAEVERVAKAIAALEYNLSPMVIAIEWAQESPSFDRGHACVLARAALAALSGPPSGSPPPSPLDVLALARVAALRCGYALTIHGSLSRDVDLVAVPWKEEAAEPADLVERIREAVGGYIMVADDSPDRGREGYFTIGDSTKHSPVERPHGRKAWSIYGVLGGSYIDLSVMPRRAAALSGGSPPNADKSELARMAYTLCLEIENLPASEQQTRCSVAASQLLTALGVERVRRVRGAPAPGGGEPTGPLTWHCECGHDQDDHDSDGRCCVLSPRSCICDNPTTLKRPRRKRG